MQTTPNPQNNLHEERTSSGRLTLRSFIEQKFSQRRCCVYVPQSHCTLCECGRQEEWHQRNNIPSRCDQIWTVSDCTQQTTCKAYGKIRMLGFTHARRLHQPHYIRVDQESTDFEALWTLMIKYWNMKEPQTILSIAGTVKSLKNLPKELTGLLLEGITRISLGINTWLMTGGKNAGVDKLVAEIAAKRPFLMHPNNRTHLYVVGIAPWGCIRNREYLNNITPRHDGGVSIQNYIVSNGDEENQYISLNHNHTHFIFVDNGKHDDLNSELDFRSRFEVFCSNKLTKSVITTCARVQLVIGGGPRAAFMVAAALRTSTPVVIVKGSGKLADTLCRIYEKLLDEEFYFVEDVETLVQSELENTMVTSYVNYLVIAELSQLFITNLDLIHIYNYESERNELDKTILVALLKSQSNFSIQGKLDLLMQLDRCDLARELNIVEENGKCLKINELHTVMLQAVKNNQSEFVKLFLDQGVVIRNFLTKKTLCELYEEIWNDDNENSPAEMFLRNHVKRISENESNEEGMENLKRVYKLLHHWTGHTVPCLKNDDKKIGTVQQNAAGEDECDWSFNKFTRETVTYFLSKSGKVKFAHSDNSHPAPHKTLVYPCFPLRNARNERIFTEQDLFLWAILFNRMPMARVFWRMGKDQISTALVASKLMERMSQEALNDSEVSLASTFKKSAEEWKEIAVNILDFAYEKDKVGCHTLLIRCLPQWTEHTCLGMAFRYHHMTFLHHAACQSLIEQVWRGLLPKSTSPWMFILAIPCYPLLYRTMFPKSMSHKKQFHFKDEITFKHKAVEQRNGKQLSYNYEEKHSQMTWWRQMKHFYTSPFTKFAIHVISYVIFLLLITYFILVELKPINQMTDITLVEWTIWIWCLNFLIEETQQISDEDLEGIERLMNRFFYRWNWLNLCIIVISFVCVPLRICLEQDSFHHARNLYSLLCSLLYIRFLEFYFVSSMVGPYVVVAFKMVKDMLYFLAMLGLMVISFGTLANAVVYHNSVFSWDLVARIFHVTYWQTYGESDDNYIFGDPSCLEGDTSCPHKSYVAVVALGLFMLVTHVILLNLIIAMFTFTFEEVHGDSQKVWAYNRHSLVHEYVRRQPWPFPFSALAVSIYICRRVVRHFSRNTNEPDLLRNTPLRNKLTFDENQTMTSFEQNAFAIFWKYESKKYTTEENIGKQKTIHQREATVMNNLYLINHKLELLEEEITFLVSESISCNPPNNQ